LRARYYDPVTGEFISTDPLVSQTLAATRYAANDPLNVLDLLGLDDWYNPFTWGSKSWAIAATAALVIGGVALAFTGVGLIADAAVIALGTVEVSAATVETVAAVGTAADVIGVATGSVATAFDWGACTIHKDNEACGAAIVNTVGLSFGAGGLATAASKYGTEGLALAYTAHSFAYSSVGYAMDWDSHNREGENPC
jgi:hypothetical protein